MTSDDLARYKAVERPALRGRYRGYDIVSMPPLLRRRRADRDAQYSGRLRSRQARPRRGAAHDEIEAMKRAYADRAVYMGDPDSVKNADRRADLESLRRSLARADRPARDARRRGASGKPSQSEGATPRISPSSTATAMRCRTPTPSISATASAWSPTAPACCSTTSSTFHRQARDRQCLRPARLQCQPAGAKQTPVIVDDAGHRAQGRKTGADHRLTGGSRIITAVLQVLVNIIDFNMPIAQA